MPTDENGISGDTKAIIYTIIATGIGISAIVSMFVGTQITQDGNEVMGQHHVNDMRWDYGRRMDSIENQLTDINYN